MISQLEKGTVPWRQPWADNGPPRNLISKRSYNGINVFLLSMRGYASPFWVTENQIKKIGASIKPGESPADVTYTFWLRTAGHGEGSNKEERRASECRPAMGLHQLYNTDQCEGISPKLLTIKKHRFDAIERCETIINMMPNVPKIGFGEPKAYYWAVFDSINMPNPNLFLDKREYYSVLFHELVHSTGNDKRLGRHKKQKQDFNSKSHQYSLEELVAEMGASFLCAHAGIADNIDNSASYVGAWLKKISGDFKLVYFAANQAQKAFDYILRDR